MDTENGAEDRALAKLRNGMGTFGTLWEEDLPDEVVVRSMDYKWTLLGEHLRDFALTVRKTFRIGHRGS